MRGLDGWLGDNHAYLTIDLVPVQERILPPPIHLTELNSNAVLSYNLPSSRKHPPPEPVRDKPHPRPPSPPTGRPGGGDNKCGLWAWVEAGGCCCWGHKYILRAGIRACLLVSRRGYTWNLHTLVVDRARDEVLGGVVLSISPTLSPRYVRSVKGRNNTSVCALR